MLAIVTWQRRNGTTDIRIDNIEIKLKKADQEQNNLQATNI